MKIKKNVRSSNARMKNERKEEKEKNIMATVIFDIVLLRNCETNAFQVNFK